MRLTFRQGIARYQTDVLNTPIFLQRSTGAGTFVDLIVSPDPTIVVFAHKNANYIFEELKTVTNAWGPIVGGGTIYLYWDINLLTGGVTRGITLLPPIYSGSAPSTPSVDQHWFDTTETTMKVWNGAKWLDKIRVFAGYLTSGSIIHPYRIGTQAGINVECEGGNLVLDSYNKPLRQSDGTFVTSVTNMIIIGGAAKNVKFEAEALSGMATEPVPKYSLIQMRPGRQIVLARSNEVMSRIAGMVLEDLFTNEVGEILTDGLVRNENWSWPPSSVNRPVFCDINGAVTIVPPTVGVSQIAGFVYDTDSIYMNIYSPVILDDLFGTPPPPPPPPPLYPIADFFASSTTGDAPFTVNFTNTSLGAPTSYEWDFTNDGVVESTLEDPSYTYATPGTYEVRLRAINGFGDDTEIKTGYITVTLAPPAGLTTNLGVTLGGPSQTNQNLTFPVSISVSNDGFLTATNVTRVLTIPDLKGQQILVSSLPMGTTVVHSAGKTVVTFPVIPTIASGLTYGPVFFNVTAPPRTGSITIQAVVDSPEIDSTIGDNTTSIAVLVRS